MNKYAAYTGVGIAVIALLVALLSLGVQGDEAMGLHPGSTSSVSGNLSVSGNVSATGNVSTSGYVSTGSGVENVRLPSVASVAITYASSGALFTVADGEVWIVHGVLVNVTTNFDCTGDNCTLTIGDGNDADGFIVLADAELQAADTEATGFAAGWQGMAAATRGVYLDEVTTNAYTGGFVYAPSGAAETIDIAIGGTSPAAGAGTVYVIYTRVQ